MLNKDKSQRLDAAALLKSKWLMNIDTEKLDELVGVNILNKMTKFVLGKGLKKSVMSYIFTRKLYSEDSSELLKLFNEIDSNGDGQIDFNEFVDKYSKYFKGTKREIYEKIIAFFDSIDIDKTGSITYSEFLTVNSVINKQLSRSTLKQVFDFYDFDGNGFIEASDIKEIFEDTNIHDDQFQSFIDDYDVNGDRKISFDEFYNMIIHLY
jgi:Ca2+-binding EF-hand superfamily protein